MKVRKTKNLLVTELQYFQNVIEKNQYKYFSKRI